MVFLRLRQGAQSLEEVLSAGNFEVNYNSPQAAGLVGWWPMLASRGISKLRDMGGQGLDGTFYGGLTWGADAKLGAKLTYNGSTGIVAMGDVLDRVFAGVNAQFTLSGWVRVNAAMTNNYWMAKYDNITGEYREFILGVYTGSATRFVVYTDGVSNKGISALGATTLTDTTVWYHITATYNGALASAFRINLYVNGIAEAVTTTVTGTPTSILDSPSLFTVGGIKSLDGTLIAMWNGSVAGAVVNTCVLPPSTIWQMAQPETMWELYRPLRHWWAVNPSAAAGVPGLWPRYASIGARGKPYISPNLGVNA